jgi:hypothetical protein
MIDTLDPAAVISTFNGHLLGGFMDGTYITVERDEDTWSTFTGADGEFARVRNRNKAGTVKFTLMQSSSSNDYLSTLMILDEATGAGTGVWATRDNLGRTVVSGADCFILKPATVEFGKEMLGREWTLKVPQLDMFIGGNGLT